jgi:hypothetical protein
MESARLLHDHAQHSGAARALRQPASLFLFRSHDSFLVSPLCAAAPLRVVRKILGRSLLKRLESDHNLALPMGAGWASLPLGPTVCDQMDFV